MKKLSANLYKEENAFVVDAYNRFISKFPILRKQKGYKLFTISGCEPGVGATTTAINSAIALADSKQKTLLIDADMHKGLQKKRLNQHITYGFSDYLSDHVELSDIIYETNIEFLDYIACGRTEEPLSVPFYSTRLDCFLERISTLYDYVLFDTSALDTVADTQVLISKTSGVILVAGHMITHKSQILAAQQEVERLGANIIGVLMNKVPRKKYKRYVGHYDYYSTKKSFFSTNKRAKNRVIETSKYE